MIVQTHRGWWCPKEKVFFRGLVAPKREVKVAYTRSMPISADP